MNDMNKEEQIEMLFRNLMNKKVLLEKYRLEESLKGYKHSEVHCIAYIGRNTDPNVTKLANFFYVTRGAISKISKKLIKKGLIESYQKPDNRKEIYFRLTEQGKAVYKIHEDLHKEFQERDRAVFEQTTDAQFYAIFNFAERYSRHLDEQIEKLEVDITIGNNFV